jgi:Secretion system C-terminal sorting domain
MRHAKTLLLFLLLATTAAKAQTRPPATLNPVLQYVPCISNEADTYIRYAYITANEEKLSIRRFVNALKYFNIWNDIHALYIPLGGRRGQSLNLRAPYSGNAFFQLSFPNGASFTEKGIRFNGVNQYAQTHYTPVSQRSHIMLYTSDNINTYFIAAKPRGINSLMFNPNDEGRMYLFHYGNSAGVPVESGAGFSFVQRSGNTLQYNRQGVFTGEEPDEPSTAINYESKVIINSSHIDGVEGIAAAGFQVLSLGNCMDMTKANLYYKIVHAFLSELKMEYGSPGAYPDMNAGYIEPVTQYKWKKTTDSCVSYDRDGSEMIQLGRNLYLFGGWNPYLEPQSTNSEVYVSSGKLSEWKKLPDAPWSGRHTFGKAVLNDGYAYIWGGDYASGDLDNDCWRTRDFMNWEKRNEACPFGNRSMYAAWSDGFTLYTMCGQVSDKKEDGVFSDLWQSSDGGLTWQQSATNLPFAGQNLSGTVTVFNNRFYLVTGGEFDRSEGSLYRTVSSQVWVSDDKGSTWTRKPDAPFRPRQYANTIVFDEKIWVIGGSDTVGQNMRDVWYMTPDEAWHELGSTPWEERHASSVAVYNENKLVVACGHLKKDAWVLERSVGCTQQAPSSGQRTAASPAEEAIATAAEIKEEKHFTGVSIIPNPASDKTQLQFLLDAPQQVSVQVSDMSGRLVQRVQEGVLAAGPHRLTIDMQALKPGIYLVRLLTAQQQFTVRVVKQ